MALAPRYLSTLGVGLSNPSGPLHVYTNNSSNALVVGSNACVGIGLTAPTGPLHVMGQGASAASVGLYVGSNAFVGIGKTAPAYALDVAGDLNFSGTFRSNGVPYVGSQFATNAVSNITLATGSNLGVGLTTPLGPLQVMGQGASAASVGLFVGSNALVGIGKTTPAYALDIAGDLNFSGTFRSNGVPYVGSQFATNAVSNITLAIGSNLGIGLTNPAGPLQVMGQGASASTVGLFVGSNAYVGIGKTNPAYTLDVLGNAYVSGNLTVAGSNIINNTIVNNTLFESSNVRISNAGTGPALYVSQQETTAQPLAQFIAGTAQALFINSLGQVGVGQASAAFALDVLGDVNFSGTLRSNGSAYVGSQWTTVATSNVTFSNAQGGFVGIGKAAPAFALDVAGDLNFSGTLRSNGAAYVGSQFATNAVSNITLASGSNLGVGLSNPSGPLQIMGQGASSAVTGLFVASNALVGVGKSNPTFSLDILGDINFTGTLRSNGVVFSTGSGGSGGGGGGGSGGSTTNAIWYTTSNVTASNYIGLTANGSTVVQNVGTPFSATTGLFTCPTAGTYQCNFVGAIATVNDVVYVYRNGAAVAPGAMCYGNTNQNSISMSVSVVCAVGDTLGFYVASGTCGAGGTGNIQSQCCSIFLVGGGSQFTTYATSNVYLPSGTNLAIGKSNAIAALDVVGNINFSGNLMTNGSNLTAQSAYQISYVFQPSANTTGPAFVGASGTTTVLKYTDTYNNASTALNTTTMTFTAPVSGTYMVSAYNIENQSTGTLATMYVSVNGSTTDTTYAINVETDMMGNSATASYPISLSTGNTVQFYVASGGVYGSTGAGGIASKGRYSIALMSMNASLGLVATTGMGVPNQVVFTSGSSTWTVPTGVTAVQVELVGGGGGGGNGNSYSSGGGGAGGYIRAMMNVTASSNITYTAGSGGAAQSTNSAAGNAGSATTVSYGTITLTANGGGGGQIGSGTITEGGGGLGGSTSVSNLSTYIANNGGDGTFGGPYNNPYVQWSSGGTGGASYFGGGGTGSYTSTAAKAGSAYGAGGGGGGNVSGGGGNIGAAGAGGVVIITYYTQSGLPINYMATAPLSMLGSTLSVAAASTSNTGVVQIDGTSIVANASNVISAGTQYRNRVINGDMRLDQALTASNAIAIGSMTAALGAASNVVDRWQVATGPASSPLVAQQVTLSAADQVATGGAFNKATNLSQVPMNGLIAYIPFDGSSATDILGALTNPTWTGTAAYSTVNFTVGTASLNLSANTAGGTASTYVTYTNTSLNITSAMTVSFWMYMNALPSSNYIAPFCFGSSYTYDICITGAGYIYSDLNVGGTATATGVSGVPALSAGKWIHVCGTVAVNTTGGNIMYVNGAFYSSANVGAGNIVTGNLRLGSRGDNSFAFNGYIDEVRIYNRALSASEVAALAGSVGIPQAPSATNLTTQLTFDNTTADAQGNLTLTSGGTIQYVSGKVGATAVYLANEANVSNATNPANYLQNTTYNLTASTTVACWLYCTQMASGFSIPWQFANPGVEYLGLPCNGTLLTAASGNQTSGFTWAANTWYHVVVTWVPSTIACLYVNGVFIGSNTTNVYAGSSSCILKLGGSANNGQTRPYAGYIDDFRIYNIALTTSQVTGLYYASPNTGYVLYQQPIEGQMLADYAWGTSAAQPVTVSAWIKNVSTASNAQQLTLAVNNNGAFSNAPMACYTFDNGLADSSGNGYTLTAYGTATATSAQYKTGTTCASISGNATGAAQVNYLANTSFTLANNQVTMSCWFWGTDTASSMVNWTYLMTIGTNGNGLILYITKVSGALYLRTNGCTNTLTGGGAGVNSLAAIPTYASWNHAAVTWDGVNACLYFNGIYQGSMAMGGATLYSNTGVYLSGSATSGNATYGTFNGYVDDARIYNSVLTASQIQQLYLYNVNSTAPFPNYVPRSVLYTTPTLPANAWTKVSFTLPGDVTGTWPANNTTGLNLTLCLGAGSNYSSSSTTWQNGLYYTASNQVFGASNAFLGNLGNSLLLTGVQLEKGSNATPYEFRPYAIENTLSTTTMSSNAVVVPRLATASVPGVVQVGSGLATSSGIMSALPSTYFFYGGITCISQGSINCTFGPPTDAGGSASSAIISNNMSTSTSDVFPGINTSSNSGRINLSPGTWKITAIGSVYVNINFAGSSTIMILATSGGTEITRSAINTFPAPGALCIIAYVNPTVNTTYVLSGFNIFVPLNNSGNQGGGANMNLIVERIL